MVHSRLQVRSGDVLWIWTVCASNCDCIFCFDTGTSGSHQDLAASDLTVCTWLSAPGLSITKAMEQKDTQARAHAHKHMHTMCKTQHKMEWMKFLVSCTCTGTHTPTRWALPSSELHSNQKVEAVYEHVAGFSQQAALQTKTLHNAHALKLGSCIASNHLHVFEVHHQVGSVLTACVRQPCHEPDVHTRALCA